MEQQENRFVRGFNSGYFLAEHEPELGVKVIHAADNAKDFSEYAHGLVSGYAEYANEKSHETKEQIATHTQETTTKTNDPETVYQTGFNHGYLLTKYEPELARQIITSQKNPNDYHQGLTAGKQEYEIESLNDRLKNLARSKGNDKEQDKSKER